MAQDRPPFNPYSVDLQGKLFIEGSSVYRKMSLERDWLNILGRDDIMASLCSAGLVKTWLVDEAEGLVQHEYLPFMTYPPEFTPGMLRDAALCVIDLAIALDGLGLHLIDAHCWNVTFRFGRPIFVDFSSIHLGRGLSERWVKEFFLYLYLPLWSRTWRRGRELGESISRVLHWDHMVKFGKAFLSKRLFRVFNLAFWRIFWRHRKKLAHAPVPFLLELKEHITSLVLPTPDTEWGSYPTPGSDYADRCSYSEKAIAIEHCLSQIEPCRLVDLACNSGWLAGLAACKGFTVLGVDYDSNALEQARTQRAGQFGFDVASMDLLWPTPAFGRGLSFPSATNRWQCDTLVLSALVHHLCIRQSLSLDGLRSLILSYGPRNVILEFIPFNDKHLVNWQEVNGTRIPEWYRESTLIDALIPEFRCVERLNSTLADPLGPECSRRSILFFRH